MSFSMFAPKQNYGERPGHRTSASFLQRLQEEMYAALGTSADGPLTAESSPWGTQIGLERVTLDLRRFVLTEDLLAGSFAEAKILIYDNSALTWTITGEEFTVWDSLTQNSDGSVLMSEGQYGFAKWFVDNGLWEVVQVGDLVSDAFFPARLDSHTGTSPIEYAWTEMEWTSTLAAATVKSGGRTGTIGPDSWMATELNNNSVANNTIVWMKRGFRPTSPAAAVITKTASGNGAGVHAAFSLYIDDNTTTGGTYTIMMDGFATTIPWNASSGTTKSAIETATGYTLSAFAGAGTLASPWTFTVSSDVLDHSASTNTSALKDKSGFRFDMSAGGSAGLCGWGAMPAATGTWKVVVKQDADDCFGYVEVQACTTPVDIFGGTIS